MFVTDTVWDPAGCRTPITVDLPNSNPIVDRRQGPDLLPRAAPVQAVARRCQACASLIDFSRRLRNGMWYSERTHPALLIGGDDNMLDLPGMVFALGGNGSSGQREVAAARVVRVLEHLLPRWEEMRPELFLPWRERLQRNQGYLADRRGPPDWVNMVPGNPAP